VISSNWLSEMVSHVMRSDVGAVGAKLLYGNGTLQHAGVILGIGGWAGHFHKGFPRYSAGYAGRASLVSEFSAVTGACLLIRADIYNQLGGLNDVDLKVACNDVDLCLRIRTLGLRIVWTPYAELFHHESATRGFEDDPVKRARFAQEVSYMRNKWGEIFENDPMYSPNLTLDHEDASFAWPPRAYIFKS
jgi:GT2 family glycosyltransferase